MWSGRSSAEGGAEGADGGEVWGGAVPPPQKNFGIFLLRNGAF